MIRADVQSTRQGSLRTLPSENRCVRVCGTVLARTKVMHGHHVQPVDLLRKLGDLYRHVEQEYERESPKSATRRRIAREMTKVGERFERLVVEWVLDEALRERWRRFLHGREPAPDHPELPSPPLFRGTTEAGTVIELRPRGDGYDVLADGARIDHTDAPWHLDPDMRDPIRINEYVCQEQFLSSPEAVGALGEFVAGRADPPWDFVGDLVQDGLIDTELSLTSRGARRLHRPAPMPAPMRRARTICVLVADAVRARVWVLDSSSELEQLTAAAEITNPTLRARDSEIVSETRPSLRREGPGMALHSASDRRESRRREVERHFAGLIAEEAAGVWRRYPNCELIVAAAPVMLGLLRTSLARHIRSKDELEVRELGRELSKLSGPVLHDQLADAGLLPPRVRLPPLYPTPGLPV